MNEVSKSGAFLLGVGMAFDLSGRLGMACLPVSTPQPLLASEFAKIGTDFHRALDAIDLEILSLSPRSSDDDRQLTLL